MTLTPDKPNQLTAQSIFRQHAFTGVIRRCKRHWLMDNKTGRELLAMALLSTQPLAKVPLIGVPHSVDHLIEPYIDRLGLRELQEPQGPLDIALVELQLVLKMGQVALRLF